MNLILFLSEILTRLFRKNGGLIRKKITEIIAEICARLINHVELIKVKEIRYIKQLKYVYVFFYYISIYSNNSSKVTYFLFFIKANIIKICLRIF